MAIGTTSAGHGTPLTTPVIDLVLRFAGAPCERDAAGARLKDALERVGFFFIFGHGAAANLVSAVYERAWRACVAWLTVQNDHGEADTPTPR